MSRKVKPNVIFHEDKVEKPTVRSRMATALNMFTFGGWQHGILNRYCLQHTLLICRLDHMKFNVVSRPKPDLVESNDFCMTSLDDPIMIVDQAMYPLKCLLQCPKIDMNIGNLSLFCCADACAATLDIISALSDEISLSNEFLESRAKVIPRRLIQKNMEYGNMSDSDFDDDSGSDTTEKTRPYKMLVQNTHQQRQTIW